jgi:LuxR family maltose regulon positive regulatory protein
MNKPHAALRYLISSRECINATALFHLRGLSEQFLFRVYHLLDDGEAMTDIYQKAKQQVEHMHYEKHKGFQLLCGVTLATVGTQKEIQPELEQAELVFQQQGVHCRPLILEALTLATLGRLTRSVTAKNLEESLKHLRYIGRIAQMQLVLVHLATLYHQEDQSDKSQKALKEALQLYRDHGCCAAFSHMNFEMQQILFQADPTAARQMHLPLSVKGSTSKRNVHPALLTIREKEVVQLMADGKTNAEISTILFISVGTIKWHINHIFSKLEATNRVQAIQKARQAGEI